MRQVRCSCNNVIVGARDEMPSTRQGIFYLSGSYFTRCRTFGVGPGLRQGADFDCQWATTCADMKQADASAA
jgi:hypothetical protein